MSENNYVINVFEKLMEQDNIIGETNGFHFKSHARSAMIYYIDKDSIIPIDAEMSGVDYLDILVYGEVQHIQLKYFPKEKLWVEISDNDRLYIQKLLVEWLNDKRLRHNIIIDKKIDIDRFKRIEKQDE